MNPITLQAGHARATVVPDVGGRLGQLDFGDGPLLRDEGPDHDWVRWGSYPLLPWSNRIPGGHLRFGDIDEYLPVNFPDGTAIHGLTAACPWEVRSSSQTTADLEVVVDVAPFQVRGSQTYELTPDELRYRLAVTNEGNQPVPAGLGIHPWFRAGVIRVAADCRWPGEPLPTGAPELVAGPFDLRGGAVPEPMDVCFTSLTSSVAEVPGLRLSWDGPITNIVVYSGDQGWVCVEPVTMANNGFAMAQQNTGPHGVHVLASGESLAVDYRFERAT